MSPKLLRPWLLALSLVPPMAGAVTIPSSLAVPSDLALILTAKASGAQIYVCSPGKDDPSQLGWSLKAPEATLFDESGATIGKHYGGPSWELTDGSLVTGEVKAKDPGPNPSAIPWLMLKVANNSGKGQLAGAQAVQRVATEGGVAPAQACEAGQELRIPYSATYLFYGGMQ